MRMLRTGSVTTSATMVSSTYYFNELPALGHHLQREKPADKYFGEQMGTIVAQKLNT